MQLKYFGAGLVWAILITPTIRAQTQMDLATQSKNVDFSAAPSTRPVKIGTVFPASCQTGAMFFKTDSAAGANLFGCTAASVWTLLSGGSSGASNVNCTVSNIGGSLQLAVPCVVWLGTTSHTLAGTASFTPTSGTGTVRYYLSAAGVFTAGSDTVGSCNSNCVYASGNSAYPVDAVPIAHATITNGALGALTDDRGSERGFPVEAGPGVLIGVTGGVPTISAQQPLTGVTGSIGGAALSAGACTSGTATISGAASGMASLATPNTYPGDGVVWKAYVSSANNVTVAVCAVVAATPVSSTYNVRVNQ